MREPTEGVEEEPHEEKDSAAGAMASEDNSEHSDSEDEEAKING